MFRVLCPHNFLWRLSVYLIILTTAFLDRMFTNDCGSKTMSPSRNGPYVFSFSSRTSVPISSLNNTSSSSFRIISSLSSTEPASFLDSSSCSVSICRSVVSSCCSLLSAKIIKKYQRFKNSTCLWNFLLSLFFYLELEN